MRILFVAKRYYTNKDLLKDRFGRLFHLPVQLAAQGVHVDVAVIEYRNPDQDEMQAGGVLFRTVPATARKILSLPLRLYRAVSEARPDIIIASGDSHIGFLGLRIARRLGARFVFDVYDYYPAFAGNRLPGMAAMFRAAVKEADLVLCASEPLCRRLSASNPHTLLVENGVDQTLFAPRDQVAARRAVGLAEHVPLIGYFGSITPSRGPLLIEACRLVRDETPTLQLLLAGRVSDFQFDEPWITYLGELPQDRLPDLINACDVVAIPYADDAFNSMAGACKIGEYLACAKPVVVTRVSGHERTFGDVPASLCKPEPIDMARAILHQLSTPQVAKVPETLDWKVIGRVLHESLSAIIR